MAADAFLAYEKGLEHIALQDVDFENDTIVALLLDTAHTVDIVNDEFISDIVADECGDGDYARETLTTCDVSVSSGSLVFDCDDIDFGDAVTISARHCVIAKNTGSDATSQLLFISDLNNGGGNLSSTSSDFDVTINANGIYAIDINP